MLPRLARLSVISAHTTSVLLATSNQAAFILSSPEAASASNKHQTGGGWAYVQAMEKVAAPDHSWGLGDDGVDLAVQPLPLPTGRFLDTLL